MTSPWYGLCTDSIAAVMTAAVTRCSTIHGAQCSIVHTAVISSRIGHIGGQIHNHGDTGYLMPSSELRATDILRK